MRRLSFLLALFALLTLSAQAQTVSSCTVSGILYKTTNVPCTSCTLQIVQVEVDGAVIQTVAQTITSDASTGAVSFTVPQRSITTIRANMILGRYDFRSGIRLYIPASSTANLHELLSEADALRTLTATGYAPSSATFITRTAESGLSAEFSLGTLTSGLLKHTVSGSTSTPATAVAGTDYVAPGAITTSGLTLSSGVLLGRTTASTGAVENITPSARFDFSSGALDLATSGVSAGTCTNCDLTIDAYGRVTAKANGTGGGGSVTSVFGRTGAVVAATNDYTWAQIDKTTSSLADITTRSASDLSSGTLPLARLSGITNTELSASAAIALSKLAALTASRAAVTDASGVLTASSVTSTELGYLSGVTSAIQTQLGNKQDLDSDLTALAGNSTNGLWARTGAGTGAARTITGTTDKITVTNGDGVSGNPTLTIASTYAGQNTITTLGTITTGTWNGAVIGAAYGGAGTVSGLLKANGSGTVSAAVSGTDYAPATSGSAILKGNGSGGFSSAVAGTDYLAPTGSGASLTNVVNSITGTANQVTASASTGAVTLSLPQDIATTSNTRFGNLGLGVAAPTNGGQISATLGANNITGLLIKRNTDTSPTGNYFDFQNAAGTTVAKLDVAGALTVTSCTGCGGGGSGITVGTTTITGGTNTHVLYNNSGVVGGYAITGTGNVVMSAAPTLTGRVSAADGLFATSVTTGTGSSAGLQITANSLTTGNGTEISSSSVSSGNVVSIAATGTAAASNTKTALNVATSGANGTSTQTTYGVQISNTSTGTSSTNIGLSVSASGGTNNTAINVGAGQILVPNGTASLPSYSFTSSATSGIIWNAAGFPSVVVSGTNAYGFSAGGLILNSTYTYSISPSGPTSGGDVFLGRAGAANWRMGNTDAASPVAQTLSVQNVVGGTTNTAGVTTTIRGSLGTSQGVPGRIHLQAGGLIAASGTTQQTALDRLVVGATKVLTNNSAITIANVTAGSNTSVGGRVDYCVEVGDGTDVQYECGSATYGVSNKGGVFSGNTVTKFGNHQNATAGTLTVTFAISGANPALLSVNANSSLTPSTGFPRITYSLQNLGQQAVAIQ